MIILFLSIVNDINLSAFHLNSELKKSEWKWKILFNPYIDKQDQTLHFQ